MPIILSEFKYYNKRYNFISNEKLKEIIDTLKISENKLSIYWTNDTLAEHGIGFEFKKYMTRDMKLVTEVNKFQSDIKFKVEDFNRCKHIYKEFLFITFDLDEIEYNTLNKDLLQIDYNNKRNIPRYIENNTLIKTLNSWNEVTEIFWKCDIKIKADNYTRDNDFDKVAEKIFGYAIPEPEYEINSSRSTPDHLFHIAKVKEVRIDDKNYRITLMRKFSGRYSGDFVIQSFCEDHIDYNYIDEGRIWFKLQNDKSYFLDLSINNTVEIEGRNVVKIDMDLFRELERDAHTIATNNKIITPQIYRFYRERVIPFESRGYNRIPDKDDAIITQYKKLLIEGKSIKIDDVLISNTKIQLTNDGFIIEYDKNFIDIVNVIYDIRKCIKSYDIKYNFNQLYEKILSLSKLRVIHKSYTHDQKYKTFSSAWFSVNGLKIEVRKDTTRLKINDIFCRIDDILHILNKAICYTNIDEFNEYVKDVSYIGIQYKIMISNGLVIELNNPFSDLFAKLGKREESSIFMRFSLSWDIDDRRRVYLMLNGKKYQIVNKMKFRHHFNFPKQTLSMSELKRYLDESLGEVPDELLIDIIDNAIGEAKIIRARGEELVKNTIKDIKAEVQSIEIAGKKVEGFIIIGNKTKAKYFIDKNDLTVYKFANGTWNRRCVVDDHRKQRIFEDRLANRLINIFNEPAFISTLHNI